MTSNDYNRVFFRGPPFRNIKMCWWDKLERNQRAKERLYRNESRLYVTLINDAPSKWLHIKRIARMHEAIFDGVFPDLCGRFRGPEPHGIPINVNFGNHRGSVYEDVPAELEVLDDGIDNMLRQLDDLVNEKSRADFKEDLLKAAAYTHCELIRIHPFPNGNGRVSRAAMGFICARYGFLPVAITRPTGEYLEANNTWLYLKNIEHFADFLRPLVLDP